MDDSSKVLEYSKMDENGNRLEFSNHKMNMAYAANAASRGLIQKFITAGIIPTELPSAEYNDDGSVFSTFNSDRIPSELLMNAKWREDAEELLALIEKVLNKESNLSFLLAARTVESEEDWKSIFGTFSSMLPSEVIYDEKEIRIVITAFDVLSDAVARFAVPEDRITLEMVETKDRPEEVVTVDESFSLPELDITELD